MPEIKSIYFTFDELKCKCGCGACDIQPQLMRGLNALRAAYGAPMMITSGYRCQKYNARVGGELNSFHMVGLAVDVLLSDSSRRYQILELAPQFGFTGIGLDKAFIHMDMRKTAPVAWIYPV